jgi:transcriptional regulator with XRE-family HTH domain
MEKSIHTSGYAAFLRLLQTTRMEAGVTQADLADRLKLTQSQVSKIERGETRLDVIQLRAVCSALGTTLTAFVRKLERDIRHPA